MGRVLKQGQMGSEKFKGCQEEGVKGINTGQEGVRLRQNGKIVLRRDRVESRGSQTGSRKVQEEYKGVKVGQRGS